MASNEGFLINEQREILKVASQNVDILSSSPKSPSSLLSEHHLRASAGSSGQNHTTGNATKHVHRSHSGKFVRIKKDGGGGEGTWGKLLDTDGNSHIDQNDPNYDSGEEPYQLVGSTVTDPLDEYKKAIVSIIEEYFTTGDVDLAASDLRELGSIDYHSYFIKRLISMSMDRHGKEKEMASVLLSALYDDVISPVQIRDGFLLLLESADDLVVDILDAVDILALFLARAVVDDILPPAFLSRAQKALSESSKGVQVIQTAVKSYLSAPHHAELVERKWGGSTHITVEEVKKKIADLLREYVDSGDTSESCRCMRESGVSFFHQELVKRALVLAMEIRTAEPLILKLLKEAAEEGLISSSQMVKGFSLLTESLNDLALDIPSAKNLFRSWVHRAISEGWLDASFMKSACEDGNIAVEDEKLRRLSNGENSQDKATLLCKETEIAAEGDGKRLSKVEKATLLCKETEIAGVGDGKRLSKVVKCRSRLSKVDSNFDCGIDADGDQPSQGIQSSREEKVSSLKTGLVHVSRKMPKNAHAHFILGLMYQRLGQPQKAALAYEKAEEILLGSDSEIGRPELLALVHIHHAQCLLLETSVENNSNTELESQEIEEILSKLKESVQSDIRQAAFWNTLGVILLQSGRLLSAISVFSTLLAAAPDNFDCLGNLGIAHLQSGNLDLSERCFQELILKNQNHPSALINYAALLLCKYGSVVAGAGASAMQSSVKDLPSAVSTAKECLLTAVKGDPKAAHIWANLANAFNLSGDYRSSAKCLEKAAKLEPNCMATRYAVAYHRIKDAERSQDPNEQLSWAGNEMASIIRDGDSAPVERPIAWAGLAMVHKAQHDIAAAYETEKSELKEVEDHAVCSLKQALAEYPDDAVQLNQLGLHSLCAQRLKTSQKYLKTAIARNRECSYTWSNLGIALQLSEDSSRAEEIYKQALEFATSEHAHAIFSNLGNLYRQQKKYDRAKAMFTKSLQLQPGYAPAFNNLGLVFVAEGQLEEAKYCFDKALQADPLLDVAKSNLIKATAISKLYETGSPSNS